METSLQPSDILPFRRKVSFINHYNRDWMSMLMVASDLSALMLAGLLAIGVRALFYSSAFSPDRYLHLLPWVLVFVVAYALAGLYPAVGVNPVDELRRLTMVTTTTFFLLLALIFWAQSAVTFSRFTLTVFWIFATVVLPLFRWFIRRAAVRAKIWGEPIAIIGSGPVTRQTLQFLCDNRQLGLLPVVQINGFHPDEPAPVNVPMIHAEDLSETPDLLWKNSIRTAVVIPNETPTLFQSLIVDDRQFGFERLVMISSLGWVGGSAIVPYDLQGTLGLEVRRNLLNQNDQFFKRLIDFALVVVGGLLSLPVLSLITLMIRLESDGGAFYSQKRIGQHGKEIHVWKFRTMVKDADKLLAKYLEQNADLRAEWEATHKLKNDPRVTRVGKFLRKTSLDELPQLWNILKGEMSLVGPRPIVRDEIKHYNNAFRLYTQVLPGLTGLWQVSGRSDTSYDSRVRLDEYYIRHWSIWMDIYVLIRTVWVVLKRSGAY